MRFAVNSEQMKQIDDYTTEVIKIPQLVLMERAAVEIVKTMKKRITKTDRILVVCGPGNNGGDGVAAGRILFLQGYHVALLFIQKKQMDGSNSTVDSQSNISSGIKAQLEIAMNLGIPMENNNKLHEYNIIIDAIFGVGLSRPVTGIYEKIIHEINQNDNIVYSVDIPSGISADTGNIMNTAVKADETITFGFMKRGLLLYPGAGLAGVITIADIGFPDTALGQVYPESFYYDSEDLKKLPVRLPHSHKGTYGRVLVIAGNRGMSGAAYLSAKAAYRTGAGLVKLMTHPDNRIILQSLLPEALFASYPPFGEFPSEGRLSPLGGFTPEGVTEEEISQELKEALDWASVIVIGPGIGRSEAAGKLLHFVLKKACVPMIIDADAINILAEELDVNQVIQTGDRLKSLTQMLPKATVLTPHLMELSRLIGVSVSRIKDNLIDTAKQCSYNNKLIFAIKDARTIVAENGRMYINTSGNHGMATGGSGDVLTGILAALVAQGLQPYDATCLAVYIHGLAGDYTAADKGTYSMMAGDIIDGIEKVLKHQDFMNR